MKKDILVACSLFLANLTSFAIDDSTYATALAIVDNPEDSLVKSAVYAIAEAAYCDGDSQALGFIAENLENNESAKAIFAEIFERHAPTPSSAASAPRAIEIQEDEALSLAIAESLRFKDEEEKTTREKQEDLSLREATRIAEEEEQKAQQRIAKETQSQEELLGKMATFDAVLKEAHKGMDETHKLNNGDVHKLSPYVSEHKGMILSWFDRLAPILNLKKSIPDNLRDILIGFDIPAGQVDDFIGKLSNGTDGETQWAPREIFSIAYAFGSLLPPEETAIAFKAGIRENYETEGGCVPGIINRLFVIIENEINLLQPHIEELILINQKI